MMRRMAFRSALIAATVAACLAFSPALPRASAADGASAPAKEQEAKKITVSGSVEKAAVDQNGKVIAVEIWAESGDTVDYFLVNDDAKGNELLSLTGKKITVTGIVEEDEDDNKIITVQTYTVDK